MRFGQARGIDTPLDLYHAIRPDLAEVIVAQPDRIADPERQLARQEEAIATLHTVVAQFTQRVGSLVSAADAPAAGDDDRR